MVQRRATTISNITQVADPVVGVEAVAAIAGAEVVEADGAAVTVGVDTAVEVAVGAVAAGSADSAVPFRIFYNSDDRPCKFTFFCCPV